MWSCFVFFVFFPIFFLLFFLFLHLLGIEFISVTCERCTTEPQTIRLMTSAHLCLTTAQARIGALMLHHAWMGASHSGVLVDNNSTRAPLRRLWVAHLHHHREHKSPRKTTAHSNMVAEDDRFIRSAVDKSQNPRSVLKAETATVARDVAS